MMTKKVALRRVLTALSLVVLALTGGCSHLNAQKKADVRPTSHESKIIPIGDSPVRGPNDAPVTIVEFGDFQCPFCGRSYGTISRLLKKYPGKLRLVFKNLPLPFHQHALAAAKAALAAKRQGKFWPMFDKLYQNQMEFTADMETLTAGWAAKMGMNVAKFKKDFDDPKLMDTIHADEVLARKLGVRGTPHFFINGKSIMGAQPFPVFDAAVQAQLAAAKIAKANGTRPTDIYRLLVAMNYHKPAPPKLHQYMHPKPFVASAKDLKVEDAPVRGPKNAPVTIFMWSDFQCPFCGRAFHTFKDTLWTKYKGKIRVVYKNFPLPFHEFSHSAALAALAAQRQGKFWPMHDLLFQNQENLGAKTYVKFAKKLGLNIAKFKNDMKDPKLTARINREMNEGRKIHVRGTPTFFINGHEIIGAQPAANFEKLIDAALKKAK